MSLNRTSRVLHGFAVKRRGTTIAAAALSVALVAPFVAPVAAPQFAAVANAQATDGTPAMTDTSFAVYNPVAADANSAVHGNVRLTYGGGIMQDGADATRPMEGVKVFAQWIEKDGSVSPTYYTVTGKDGSFHIGMTSFVGPDGNVKKFDADPALPEGEKWRIWAENPDGSKYQLQYVLGQGQVFPNGVVNDTAAGAWQGVGRDIISNVEIRYTARNSDIWRQDAVDSPALTSGNTSGGHVEGRLYWNNYVEQGGQSWGVLSTEHGSDYGIPGVEVYASYLSDYALEQINANRQLFVAEGSQWIATDPVRGVLNRGSVENAWQAANEIKLREFILENVNADRDRWIAETVKTTTDQNGDFKLQFNGTFGWNAGDPGFDGIINSRDSVLRNSNNVTNTITGETRPGTEWLGTVAPNPNYGDWRGDGADSGLNLNRAPKHINTDWMMVTTEDMPGVGLMTPFYGDVPRGGTGLNMWDLGSGAGSAPGTGAGWDVSQNDADVILESGNESTWNIKMAAIPENLNLDVTPYDSYGNYAKPGDTAEVTAFGVPFYGSKNFYEIVWVDQNGNVIPGSSTGPVKADPNTLQIAGKPLTVPADIAGPTTYKAELWMVTEDGTRIAEQPMAVDSFTAYPVDQLTSPDWENAETTQGTPVDLPQIIEGAELSGLTVDLNVPQAVDANGQFVVDSEGRPVPADGYDYGTVVLDPETGIITFTPGQDAVPGTRVPLVVRDAEGQVVDLPVVTIVEPSEATDYEPSYSETTVVPGTPAVSEPTFTDKDGNEVEIPAGAKVIVDPDFTAPEGYTVVVAEDGTITVTVDPEALDADSAEEFTVPVIVTYEDGSTDKVSAPFQLDTDGDGIPDVTDEDDDNDGFTDVEEEEAGTNPKDADSNPASAVVEDATVVEGQEIDPIDVTTVVPEGGSVEVTGLPEGLTYNSETGQIEGTPEAIADWADDLANMQFKEEREFTVTVEVKDADGNVVATDEAVITVQRDTDGDGIPDVTDEDDDNDGFTDVEEEEAGTNPKDDASVPVTPTDADENTPGYDAGEGVPGAEVVVPQTGDEDMPEGTEYTTEDGDKGISVDPVTGEVTVTIPEGAQPGDIITGIIVVTYPDGSVEEVPVEITVEDPNASDAENNNPGYESVEAEPGTEVTLPQIGDTTMPEGTEYTTPDEGNGITVDPVTGEVTVIIPEDAVPGDVITGVIIITYPDGSSEEVEISVTVTEPAVTPDWEDGSTTNDEPAVIDNVGGEVEDGTTAEVVDGPGTAEINDDGQLIVTPTEDAAPGDTITVEVKDPEGDVIDTVVVEITPIADKHDPIADQQQVTIGEEPIAEDSISNEDTFPEGTTIEFKDEVDTSTEGEKEAVVVITYPDGSVDEVDVTIEVIDESGTDEAGTPGDTGSDSSTDGSSDLSGSDEASSNIGGSSGSSDALKRCFADSDYAIWNPLYWLIPAGILTAVPLPQGVKAQLDGAAAQVNNEVNQLAGRLGMKNLLPRFEIPAELNINTYLTHDQQRGLLGAAMVIAGIAATGFYFNWCMKDGSTREITSSESSRPADGGSTITQDGSSL